MDCEGTRPYTRHKSLLVGRKKTWLPSDSPTDGHALISSRFAATKKVRKYKSEGVRKCDGSQEMDEYMGEGIIEGVLRESRSWGV